jgi:hypothetical protein
MSNDYAVTRIISENYSINHDYKGVREFSFRGRTHSWTKEVR